MSWDGLNTRLREAEVVSKLERAIDINLKNREKKLKKNRVSESCGTILSYLA